VPKQPIICIITTLQDMVSSVRTAFGDYLTIQGGDLWADLLRPPPPHKDLDKVMARLQLYGPW